MKQVRQNKADPRGESSCLSLSGVALKTPANVVEILINIVAEADGPSSRKPGGNQRPLHRSGLDTFCLHCRRDSRALGKWFLNIPP